MAEGMSEDFELQQPRSIRPMKESDSSFPAGGEQDICPKNSACTAESTQILGLKSFFARCGVCWGRRKKPLRGDAHRNDFLSQPVPAHQGSLNADAKFQLPLWVDWTVHHRRFATSSTAIAMFSQATTSRRSRKGDPQRVILSDPRTSLTLHSPKFAADYVSKH
jgi:hypothetical protein